MVTKTSDAAVAQQDLELLNQWQKTWLLSFNTKDGKCKVLHIGKDNPHNIYKLDDKALPVVESEKDLGMCIDSKLNWTEHIQKCINKAKAVVGWVSRNVISRDKNVVLNIYKSLIRPHLEYAVQLWNLPVVHGNWGLIMDIEKVQRAVTRMIDGIGLMPYKERLKNLDITTLVERRIRGDLIETFKIAMGHVPYGANMFAISRSGYNIRKTAGKKNFLPNRIANYWNKVPDFVKDAHSTDSFKRRLELYKANIVDQNLSAGGHYWEVSEMLFNKINDTNRDSYVNYMLENPIIAKRRNINIRLNV